MNKHVQEYINNKMVLVPVCHPEHKQVNDAHKSICTNPGKVPLMNKWTSLEPTKQHQIEEWNSEFGEYNIGVVLGRKSNLIRIDLDGDGGKQKFEELKRGNDTPEAPTFKTPSGGLGIIYRIPEYIHDGDLKLSKYCVKCEGKHEECAFLGDGQMSVLPPSVHANGGTYEWIEDQSPSDIPIPTAPKWIIDYMTKKNVIENAKEVGENKNLELLSKKCLAFRGDYRVQRSEGLDEESYYKWISLLVKVFDKETALAFSELSPKYNNASKRRIKEMQKSSDDGIGTTRCTSFNCSCDEIEICFGKSNSNSSGEIINSPAGHLKKDKTENKIEGVVKEIEELMPKLLNEKYSFLNEGFAKKLILLKSLDLVAYKSMIDKVSALSKLSMAKVEKELNQFKKDNKVIVSNESEEKGKKLTPMQLAEGKKAGFTLAKQGYVISFQPNRFARYACELFNLGIYKEQIFMEYKNGTWSPISDLKVLRKLRNLLHKFKEGFWYKKLEENYFLAVKREATYIEELNGNKNYINVQNGLINLQNFRLEPHRKDIFSSVQLPINYDLKAQCPNFKNFLKEIFNNDIERVRLIQQIMGYILTSETKAQKGFIFLGDGSNGKSVLCDIMARLVGKDNMCSVPLADLNKSFARSELVGKTLNLSTENEIDSNGLNTQYLKAITSGDPIRVEEKYKQGYEYRPICKMVFAVNRMPYSKDKSYGYARRLVIVPFNKKYLSESEMKDEQFKDTERFGVIDVDLTDKLLKELDGILIFALLGLKELRKNKYRFIKSEASTKAFEEYKEDINVVLAFVREAIKPNKYKRETRGTIRHTFDKWCVVNKHKGAQSMNSKRFWKEFRSALEDEGIYAIEDKSNGSNIFRKIELDIELVEESLVDYFLDRSWNEMKEKEKLEVGLSEKKIKPKKRPIPVRKKVDLFNPDEDERAS